MRRLKIAGFWIRLLAGLIDAVLMSLMAYAVAGLTFGLHGGPVFSTVEETAFFCFVVLSATLFYQVFLPTTRSWQATPGKWICGLRIMRAGGGRVTTLLALGRFLSYFVSALPAGLGFLMIGLDDQKRGLHDMICDTRVVYTPEGWRWWRSVFGR